MKALWALKPSQKGRSQNGGLYRLLRQFVSSSKNIEIGHIATGSDAPLNLMRDPFLQKELNSYHVRIVEKALKEAKAEVNQSHIHILDFETFSNTEAVDCLLRLAKRKRVDLIGLFTQGHTGFKRWTLGSFAETAIHRSKLSLLLVSPKTKFSPKIKRVLIASDFSMEAKAHLKKTLILCQKIKADLVVFHHADLILRWSLDDNNPKIVAYRGQVKNMQDWIDSEALKNKVRVEVILNSNFHSTADLILKASKKVKADLLVISAKSGPMAALLGGSVTRQVIRESQHPVLVLK